MKTIAPEDHAQTDAAAERYSTGFVVSKDGTIIGYRQVGHGPAVILLHGAMESAQSHMQLAEALADRFTIYLPDRRGRGLSGSYRKDHSIETDVEDLPSRPPWMWPEWFLPQRPQHRDGRRGYGWIDGQNRRPLCHGRQLGRHYLAAGGAHPACHSQGGHLRAPAADQRLAPYRLRAPLRHRDRPGRGGRGPRERDERDADGAPDLQRHPPRAPGTAHDGHH